MIRIPSYDDLTPSIPDVTARDTLAHVNRILPRPETGRGHIAGGTTVPPRQLFACLRSTRPPGVMMAIAREFSPRIERHGASCVVLDVSGLGGLLGDAHAIGEALTAAAGDRGPDIRVAVAPTQIAARLMAIVHPRLTVVAGDVTAPLSHAPIRALRVLIDDGGIVPGDGRARAVARARATVGRLETFHRWGLTTLGELAALPPEALFERMGQEGLLLQQLARGVDAAPLVPDPGTPRFVQSMELEWPIDALEPLSFVLARLLDPLSEALERADRGAAALRLDLRLVDRTTFQRVLQLPAAMRDPRVLRTLVLLDLESHPPAAGIDVVTIELDPAPARIIQYSLLERALPSVETLATLTARLRALVGDGRCGSPSLLETHRPDAFEMRPFAPESRAKGGRARHVLPPEGGSYNVGTGSGAAGAVSESAAESFGAAGCVAESAAASSGGAGRVAESAAASSGVAGRVAESAAASSGAPSRTPSYEPRTRNAEPRTASGEPGTRNVEPGTPSGEPRTASGEPRTRNPEPGTPTCEPRTSNPEPEPGTRNPEPGTLCLRRFRPPVAVRVTIERSRPVRVAIDRRGMPGGDVEQHAGPWRTSGAWWDAAAGAWDRDEWDVALSDGSLCRLFRDRLADRWFLEGVFD